ncbi:SDR family oxidoreductase [Nocardia sp. NBC_01329]|uniref:SDR family oxidoreductase n=1 Tax=Nocardia sp. NBC_01329 TaxID=2903594 RepID=UPI002E11585F|nr:SDR family oxidoreductase [Nocardia sp. NBC_01329]
MRGVAVVTGASRGVGRAIALDLAELGYDIAVGYHSRSGDAAEVVRAIEQLGRSARALQVDTREPDSCRALVGRARELGPIRAVVSNATGFADSSPASTSAVGTSIATYTEMFTARVGAVLSLVEAAGDDLHDGGRIVALASTGTRRHVPGYAPIAVSMAAAEALIRYLAAELGRAGVTANIASGGVIDTEALSAISANPERLKTIVAKATPLGRVGQARDLAGLVKFLCGDDGGWVNGQTLIADGGNLIA